MLSVIGLGKERGALTLAALAALKEAERVYVSGKGAGTDDLTDQGIAFLAEEISADELLKEAENKNICYCTIGSVLRDKTALCLMRKKGVRTIDCVSFRVPTDRELVEKKEFSFSDFVYILKRLRAEDGCPWDRAQTHESIRINAIEEAYELVDAIDSDDKDKILEETGDVLMQAVFHVLIEEDRGRFGTDEMLSAVCEKLVFRHTHVFGGDSAKSADGALSVWDKNKMKEKHQATYSDAVNDVPEAFPALLRAQKIVKRMAKGGWNCGDLKLEEAKELIEAYNTGEKRHIEEALGNFLMAMVNIAYLSGVDAEQTLLDTVKREAARYTEWERLVLADGKDVHALSGEEQIAYYKQAKKNVPTR